MGLTFSPVGSRFRSRIRNFPNLINCCYLNWISKWPEEALLSVALLKLEDKSVSKACVIAHDLIEQLSENFNMETRRKVFVTPKNYIELITLFNHLLASQKNKSNSSISKLSNGVYKLEEASAIIEDLK